MVRRSKPGQFSIFFHQEKNVTSFLNDNNKDHNQQVRQWNRLLQTVSSMGKTDLFKITGSTREKQLKNENVSIESKTNNCDEL